MAIDAATYERAREQARMANIEDSVSSPVYDKTTRDVEAKAFSDGWDAFISEKTGDANADYQGVPQTKQADPVPPVTKPKPVENKPANATPVRAASAQSIQAPEVITEPAPQKASGVRESDKPATRGSPTVQGQAVKPSAMLPAVSPQAKPGQKRDINSGALVDEYEEPSKPAAKPVSRGYMSAK